MTVRIITGDCREKLAEMPAESVHCIVTSPPYFGLRDYGTGQWEGGEAGCDHLEREARKIAQSNGLGKIEGYRDRLPETNSAFIGRSTQFRDICGKCGARRIDRQIGLEATPDAYVSEIVAVFREARRALRKDGTLWLNLGDSYNADARKGRAHMGIGKNSGFSAWVNRVAVGTKPKDLLGIPWRVAFALQADGWWLRSDIIWAKPNPMPESVTDRPTSAHEHIFLLAKSERYWFDAEAVREQSKWVDEEGRPIDSWGRLNQKINGDGQTSRGASGLPQKLGANVTDGKRNIRNVWTVASQPFGEAHFATFPPALIEPCIKAGCPVGGTVLDPFGGAGTTGLVADRLGRNAIIIELNPDYAAMAERRLRGDAGMFAEVAKVQA